MPALRLLDQGCLAVTVDWWRLTRMIVHPFEPPFVDRFATEQHELIFFKYLVQD